MLHTWWAGRAYSWADSRAAPLLMCSLDLTISCPLSDLTVTASPGPKDFLSIYFLSIICLHPRGLLLVSPQTSRLLYYINQYIHSFDIPGLWLFQNNASPR